MSNKIKKIWNLFNLKNKLYDNQETNIKTRISTRIVYRKAVKITKNIEPDFSFVDIDLASGGSHFHRLIFQLLLPDNTKSKANLRTGSLRSSDKVNQVNQNNQVNQVNQINSSLNIRILDSDKNILADGISESSELSLRFYCEDPLITIEFYGKNMSIGNSYHITKIMQESADMQQIIKDNEKQLADLASSTNESFNLKKWTIPKATYMIQKDLLLLNRGYLISKILTNKPENYKIILYYIMDIEEHYKNANHSLSHVNNSNNKDVKDLKAKERIKESKAEVNDYKKDFEGKDNQISDSEKEKHNLADKVQSLTKLRLQKIDELNLMQGSLEPNNSNTFYQDLKEKNQVLEQLKIYLMKELLRLSTCKKVSEFLISLNLVDDASNRNSDVSKNKNSEVLAKNPELLKNYHKQIMDMYNIIGNDLLAIEEELEKQHGLKTKLENETTDKEMMKRKELNVIHLRESVEKITDEINQLNNKIVEITNKINLLNVQKSCLFYSSLESILEKKLKELYES